MIAGGDAWYSVLAGILPRPCQQIIDAVRAGDHAEAERINIALQPICRLFRDHTSFSVVHEMAGPLAGLTLESPRPVRSCRSARRQRMRLQSRCALPEDMLA
ncbi:dihydrodipicolinate synthase family protein [Falsirhodobacter deserti]|uniref:dihydrodipicolinate synthase family protein n=1 Tax=Falsirhodobacter deserti TaxID=1365611 RepID=UPI000FE3C4CD